MPSNIPRIYRTLLHQFTRDDCSFNTMMFVTMTSVVAIYVEYPQFDLQYLMKAPYHVHPL